jgi:hypothetical protein
MGEKGGVGWFGVKSRVASFRSLSCGFFPLFFPLPLSVSCSSVASLPRYFPEERARDAGIFSWRASTDPGGHAAPRRVAARFSEAKAWRYLAVSTRRARKFRSGHACRFPRRRAFERH